VDLEMDNRKHKGCVLLPG